MAGEKCYAQNIILTMDGPIACAMSGIWCQNVWHQTDNAGPHIYPMLSVNTVSELSPPLPSLWYGSCAVGPW